MNEIDTAQDIDQTLAGLTEEERQDVRLGRAHRAREARMLAHWAAVAADLSGAAITISSRPAWASTHCASAQRKVEGDMLK